MVVGKSSMLASMLLLLVHVCLAAAAEKMLIGYFPNWLYANYPVEQIPYEKYTHLNYAFAILNNEDLLPSFPDDWAVEFYLPKLVSLAHQADTKVLLSIGGWTGSQRFSSMVASPEARQRFIDWNVNFIRDYGTDGVDIDWEYPGRQGAGCNEYETNDADNFLVLLKELRETLDQEFADDYKEISLAVHVDPFTGSDGKPMADVSAYVPYFDHINLMTYDINGAWATETGPNAPFQHEEGKGASYSFVESIKAWKNAGVPGNKMTAGLAFYGRSIKAQVDMSEDPSSQYQPAIVGAPKGDSDDAYWADPYCAADIDGVSGVWKWTNLRSEGVLGDDWETTGQGWVRYWDDVSKTPWLFHPESKVYVSYDDPKSIGIKVDHALCEDLAGVMVWDLHQDNGELLNVAQRIRNSNTPASCSIEESSVNSIAAGASSPPRVSAQASSVPQSAPASRTTFTTTSRLVVPSSSIDSVVAPSYQAASPALGHPIDSEACNTPGEQRCVDSGRSPDWITCNYNKWVVRSCSAGAVCHDNQQGSFFCGLADTVY